MDFKKFPLVLLPLSMACASASAIKPYEVGPSKKPTNYEALFVETRNESGEILSLFDIYKKGERPDGKIDAACMVTKIDGGWLEYCLALTDNGKLKFPPRCTYVEECFFENHERDSKKGKEMQKVYDMVFQKR